MLRNYFIVAIRVFLRQKIYSSIKILGLAIGISATLFIAMYISGELSYDHFHPDGERIFRVGSYYRVGGNETSSCYSDANMAGWLKQEVPEVESVLRLAVRPVEFIKYQNKIFTEKRIVEVDTNFFSFFNFKFLQGDANEALSKNDKIIITEATAKKYFGNQLNESDSPIGKILLVGSDQKAMEVAAIVADPPANSHFGFDMLVSRDQHKDQDTVYQNAYTYFKINSNTHVQSVVNRFNDFYKKYVDNKSTGDWHDMLHQPGNDYHFFIQTLFSIHLDSHLSYELDANGDRNQINLLGSIALFITLLACTNFLNLATVSATLRAKEIAVRKSIGSLQKNLFLQFMLEAYFYTFIAFLISILIIYVSLDRFTELTGNEYNFSSLSQPNFAAGMIILFAVVGLLAGGYPSVYLSSLTPSVVLKINLAIGFKGIGLRNVLLVFQFLVACILIISTITIYRQINLIQNKNPGFDRASLFYIQNIESLGKNKVTFKNALMNLPDVVSTSYSNELPPESSADFSFKVRGTEEYHLLNTLNIDHDNLKTLGYHLKQGRFFSTQIPSDSLAVVINAKAARLFRIQNLNDDQFIAGGNSEGMKIIGIIDDFNFESLRNEIKPMIMFMSRKGDFGGFLPHRKMIIRFTTGGLEEKIADVQNLWREFSSAPFEYGFLDERFEALYRTEERFGKVAMVFTLIAIVVACTGLFSLVAYATGTRAREIAIRKVMGASVQQIVFLISRNFLKLIIYAITLSIPLTWYLMKTWLSSYAYRVDFTFEVIIGSGLLVLVIAMITIGYQTVNAALRNPTVLLKSE